MVDKIKLDSKEQPYLYCENHKNSQAIFIDVGEENVNINKNVMKCLDCIVEQGIQSDRILQINKLIQCSPSFIYQNWPPLDHQEKNIITSKLIKIIEAKDHSKNENKTKEIMIFFQKLQNEVAAKINEVKDQVISRIENQLESSLALENTYNTISSKFQLKKLLTDDSSERNKINSAIRDIIIEKIAYKNQNTQELKKGIENHLGDYGYFYQDSQDQRDQIYESVKNNIFLQLDQLGQFSFNQNQNNHKNQEEENSKKVEQLMNLISNRTNCCNQQFLSELSNKLCEFSHILEDISFDNIYIEGLKQINFEDLNKDQLSGIDQLQKIMKSTSQLYSNLNYNNDNLFQQVQYNSHAILSQLRISENKEVERQFKLFPILELLPYFLDIPLPSLIPTNFKSSNLSTIETNIQNSIIFKIPNQRDGYQAYFKDPIDNSKKYMLRVKVQFDSTNCKDHFWVCLLNNQYLHKKYIYNCNQVKFRFNKQDESYNSITQVVKGQGLYAQNVAFTYDEIEIHFCVKDKVFVCADYPNYSNVCSIRNDQKLLMDDNQIYNLVFEQWNVGSQFIIKEFKSVNNYPDYF